MEVGTAPSGKRFDLPLVLRWLGEEPDLKDSDPPWSHFLEQLATNVRQQFPKIEQALHPRCASVASAELKTLAKGARRGAMGPLAS